VILREAKLFKFLERRCAGIPKVLCYTTEKGRNILVLQMLGPSLQLLLKACDGKFSLFTALRVGSMILQLLESLHGQGFVLRRWSLEGFALGQEVESGRLFFSELGHAGSYLSSLDRAHIDFYEGRSLTANRFSSLNAALGIECSRRDDLESLCYLIIEMVRGSLPWHRVYHYASRPEINL
jgi:hypothetical protein